MRLRCLGLALFLVLAGCGNHGSSLPSTSPDGVAADSAARITPLDDNPCPQGGIPKPLLCCSQGSNCGGGNSGWGLDDGQINVPYLGGVFPANIGPKAYTVVHVGHPVDGVGCARSLNVGDPLGIIGGNTQYVADLNVVAQATGTPYNYNGNLGTNTAPVAWTYEDRNGHYWVEENPAFQPQFSAGVSAWLLSFGITPATGTYAKFAGNKPPKLPSGTGYQKCWDAGMKFSA